ncbi:DUF5686 and carboxypeptidase regulatory-like domain-containing protein [Mucilaginibacter sp.]|uniref:DUF5686 and carboxypeptidase regulatory-like domain-containing protein n=1 Tax=Mucilaginibacter sp. TaxID=1882438 RepID=UPI00260E46C3|nr:DUF5686 and carboxypeptidase regulatory-like domain-containing protein [Mucilaginibacter sp.]MDB5029322.1 carboxypeptidase-like regulatory protein [Mucilaginibacter sp.]
MRSAFICFLFFIGFKVSAQQVSVSGKITDDTGNPVPFASVYIQNTTLGASANSEGDYSLQLKPGQYVMQYKAMGLKQETRKVDLKESKVINITLHTEVYQLQTVSITGNGQDPAYAIIRKAIKKRNTYLNEVRAYTCDVYIKGLQKLLDAPKKFLGRDINQIGRQIGLDSNRRGIIYLSESQSKYSFMYPGKVHEEMISSKVSGSNRAFSFNRASDLRINFYENFETWPGISLRPLISPIADNALFYYNYKYIGETVENGKTINKIQVIPRRPHDPCFEGYIYIQDDSWRLVALDLYITKKANISLADTIKINQQFVPVSNKAWMTSTIRFDFTGGLFGFKLGGYFISVYKNYDLNPTFNKKDFNEVLRITKGINKKDSTYWQQERPIPLTNEEKTDYTKKEVLAAKRESKHYLDSIDKVNNKFNLIRLTLSGMSLRDRYKKEYYRFDPLLSTFFFNTVQGFAFNYKTSFTKMIDTANNRFFRVGANIGYGISDHILNGGVNALIPVSQFTLGLDAGSDVVDMNNLQPISTLSNTVHSLFAKQNYQKLYQKQFASASLSGRITGGWQAVATVEWANRNWLPNTSAYSFSNNNVYTSNNPLLPAQNIPLFPKNQSFKLSLRTTYDFSNQYETHPNGRRYLPSPYPTIGLSFTKGIKNILSSDVDYDKLSADISKSDISMGVYGHTSFFIGAGKFLTATSLYYPDYNQFRGNEGIFYRGGISSFLLLNYYTYSTRTEYLEGHFEHNFSGFITNKIPIIRKLKLQEIVHINYLTSPELKNYYELGLGVQYLNLKVLYGTSYNSGSNIHSAIRLGISL